jgi:hypothetical protein
MFAARIVDKSLDGLGFPPDRIGPASVVRLFGEVLPATIMVPESLLAQAQQVARDWVRWRTDTLDPPRGARKNLRRVSQEVLTAFPRLCRDRRLNPAAPYVADTPAEQTDGPTLQQILDRRSFAVPLPGRRGDGVVDLRQPANGVPARTIHVDDLDASDPTHRHLITALGQAARGTHTRRIPAYAGVVEQLWHDQPAEVWRTACRLTAAGLSRQQVLDRLADTWQRHTPHGPVSDAGATPIEPDAAASRALLPASAPR